MQTDSDSKIQRSSSNREIQEDRGSDREVSGGRGSNMEVVEERSSDRDSNRNIYPLAIQRA